MASRHWAAEKSTATLFPLTAADSSATTASSTMFLLFEIVLGKISAILSCPLGASVMLVSLKAAGLILPSFPRKTEQTGTGSFRISSSSGECFPAVRLTIENKSMAFPSSLCAIIRSHMGFLYYRYIELLKIPQNNNYIRPEDNPPRGMSLVAKRI